MLWWLKPVSKGRRTDHKSGELFHHASGGEKQVINGERNDQMVVVAPSSCLWLPKHVSKSTRHAEIFVVLLHLASRGQNMSVMVEK